MYSRNAGWLYRFSSIVLAGPPADCPFLHVVFYPDRRLTVHCYKKFISGPPADGSQRVNLYSTILNSLIRISTVSHILYADDISLISSWMSSNYLTLNPFKTEFLLIGLPPQTSKKINPSLNNCLCKKSLTPLSLSLLLQTDVRPFKLLLLPHLQSPSDPTHHRLHHCLHHCCLSCSFTPRLL